MNDENTHTTSHPIGYWITAVDRLLAAEFATAFEREGVTRRDWRLLNVIDGTATAHRTPRPPALDALIERGWISPEGEGWTLTDEGRAAKERLGTIVDGIRATMSDAVDPDDFDTTVATLEKLARALGWDEEKPLPRRHGKRHGRRHGGEVPHGGRHGFAHGRHGEPGFAPGHGFGPARAFGPWHGHRFGPDADPRGTVPGFAHRAARAAQRAYERGFDAGYSRGRDA